MMVFKIIQAVYYLGRGGGFTTWEKTNPTDKRFLVLFGARNVFRDMGLGVDMFVVWRRAGVQTNGFFESGRGNYSR